MRATARGEAVFTPGLAGLVLGEFRRMAAEPETAPEPARGDHDRPIPELTERETEVLRLVATGMSYKEIAGELFLSHRTVQNHVQNTLGKLHLHNRVELVRFALARGLEDDQSTAVLRSRDGRARHPAAVGTAYRHAGTRGAAPGGTYP